MPVTRLIICEATSRWTLTFRTLLKQDKLTVTAISSIAQAFEQLQDEPTAALAVEVTETCAEECLRRLNKIRSQSGNYCVIILLDEALVSLKPGSELAVWYEAGAAVVVDRPQHLPSIKQLIRRHAETRTRQPATYREAVWQRMPWSEVEITS